MRPTESLPEYGDTARPGRAASEILQAVQTEKADLVVITTHGRGHDDIDQKSPVFGSVAEKVIRLSPVPVHLVESFG